ncbi:gliding motility lipoprotein GldB [Lutibacter citreus]|uniref:gliding motility lipoprotein GldB n=1 Tax=Lutibacter citreus TaxID=2138210 RepID=UPI000DBE229C|nr:gliding motility lipoprotein GldB [Lutibacter citreus]
MSKILVLVVIFYSIVSCKEDKIEDIDVSNIVVSLKVERFEEHFYNMNLESLQDLKKEFPFLFPKFTPDSIWLQKSNNKDEIELYDKSQQVFGDFQEEKNNIKNLFKHIKYYHPNFKSPKVITLITDLDYTNKVIYADSLLFVGLDMFLGAGEKCYNDFPAYISRNFDKSQLQVEIAKEIGLKYFHSGNKRQFIEILVDEGRKMFLLDAYLPQLTDNVKIGYSQKELSWASANESQIWKYFVENELLYSSDNKLSSRFIDKAPFSKFFIDIDKESPGRIGIWLGWQIVRSYMKNNNVTLQQLLQKDAEEIFKKSKYKPKK